MFHEGHKRWSNYIDRILYSRGITNTSIVHKSRENQPDRSIMKTKKVHMVDFSATAKILKE